MKSEAKIIGLQKEIISFKLKKTNESNNKPDKLTAESELKQEFVKLKTEFELLKLCQRNNNTMLLASNIQATSSKGIKCNACGLVFKTESGLKVHNDLLHQQENVIENIKCKPCSITCSDSEVMMKHNEREHKFKCQKCNETFKEDYLLHTHSTRSHALINKCK